MSEPELKPLKIIITCIRCLGEVAICYGYRSMHPSITFCFECCNIEYGQYVDKYKKAVEFIKSIHNAELAQTAEELLRELGEI